MRRLSRLIAAVLVFAAGCADGEGSAPAALRLLMSGPRPAATDTFEVWVCHVPDTTTDPIYLTDGARLDLTPGDVADRLEADVPEYFADLSDGAYRPEFVAGGEVTITPDDDHSACVEQALNGSGDAADAVYVVADAEHDGDRSGGSAQPGSGCDCPARTSRRAIYIGASDFDPGWGATPAVDLTEHEIGHTLGLPHSGDELVAGTNHAYTSALDVMSNSAAPRDVDTARRHGPATIAANLLALGWLPLSAAAIVPPDGTDVTLAPSNLGRDLVALATRSLPRTKRVAVIPLDDFRLLTVELLTPTGHDDHLPASGVAVHLIDQSPAVCGHTDGSACTELFRQQVVLGSVAPHTDLLAAGESLTAEGWTIHVESIAVDVEADVDADGAGTSATVALRPTHR